MCNIQSEFARLELSEFLAQSKSDNTVKYNKKRYARTSHCRELY